MPRVIVLEPTSLVLTAAEEFGEIIFISKPHKFNLFNIDDIIQRTKSKLKEIEYDTNEDFICLSGNAQKTAIFLGAVISIIGANLEFALLLFDAREAKYKKRIFRNGSNN